MILSPFAPPGFTVPNQTSIPRGTGAAAAGAGGGGGGFGGFGVANISGAVKMTIATTRYAGTTSSAGTRVPACTGGFLAGTSSASSVFGAAAAAPWAFGGGGGSFLFSSPAMSSALAPGAFGGGRGGLQSFGDAAAAPAFGMSGGAGGRGGCIVTFGGFGGAGGALGSEEEKDAGTISGSGGKRKSGGGEMGFEKKTKE